MFGWPRAQHSRLCFSQIDMFWRFGAMFWRRSEHTRGRALKGRQRGCFLSMAGAGLVLEAAPPIADGLSAARDRRRR